MASIWGYCPSGSVCDSNAAVSVLVYVTLLRVDCSRKTGAFYLSKKGGEVRARLSLTGSFGEASLRLAVFPFTLNYSEGA